MTFNLFNLTQSLVCDMTVKNDLIEQVFIEIDACKLMCIERPPR